jgi:hypothetical protein
MRRRDGVRVQSEGVGRRLGSVAGGRIAAGTRVQVDVGDDVS